MLAVTKAVLRELFAAKGALDSDTNQIVGDFVGRLEMKDGLYHGNLRYEPPGDEPPGRVVSINSIVKGP